MILESRLKMVEPFVLILMRSDSMKTRSCDTCVTIDTRIELMKTEADPASNKEGFHVLVYKSFDSLP